VPDVEGTPQQLVVSTPPDNSLATRKWLTASLIIAGVLTTAGVITFALYVYTSNMPGNILSSAIQNLLNSSSEAGTIHYQTKHGATTSNINGDFLGYTDPTDSHNGMLTVSLGQNTARVSGTMRLFTDSNYFQTAGLSNLGRLVESMHGDNSRLTADSLVRLSSLDAQWYTLTSDDIAARDNVLPRQLKNTPTSNDIQAITQLYLKHPFLTAIQQLDDEHIGNINSAHLKIGVDRAKLSEFLQAIQGAKIGSFTLSDDDIQAITGTTTGSTTAEVWITRSDHTFQQLRLTRVQSNRTDALTITFKSELAAAQRQTVLRPDSAKSTSVLLRGIHDVLTQ
jgi:hypothetical protein